MKKILFIVPPTLISLDRDMGPRHTTPHIGLAYVAGYLRNKGYDVSVIDSPVEKLGLNDIEERIRKIKPDFIGLTATSMQINEAHLLAKFIKEEIDRNMPVIIGGYHATALPKETLEYSKYFDYTVYGEGEITTFELLENIVENKPLKDVLGIAYRKSSKVIVNKPRPRIENLDELPFPALDLFPLGKYNACASTNKEILELPISSSRGCPYQCIFCARPLGNKVVARSIDSVVEEIRRDVNELKANQILFTDETFTLDRKRVYDFCNKLIKEGLNEKMKWYCETRVDLVDRSLLAKMREAGCIYIAYGIDSGNDNILKRIKKNSTVEDSKKAIRWAKEAGIKVFASCMLGHPYETKETAEQTINLILETNPDFAAFSILTPLPGSEVSKMAERGEGNLKQISSDWTKYGRQIGGAVELRNISRKELEQLQMKAYLRFYLKSDRFLNFFKVASVGAVPIYFIHQLKNMVK